MLSRNILSSPPLSNQSFSVRLTQLDYSSHKHFHYYSPCFLLLGNSLFTFLIFSEFTHIILEKNLTSNPIFFKMCKKDKKFIFSCHIFTFQTLYVTYTCLTSNHLASAVFNFNKKFSISWCLCFPGKNIIICEWFRQSFPFASAFITY